ncbi:MAG: Dyp-type peroxidase [Schleiferiaceae bacterium]|nr:Dyp-type peroxidase [Schleiferiaceae bacterium]
MATPQAGIFKEGSTHFTFLEFRLKPLSGVKTLKKAMSSIPPNEKVNEVISFGHVLWKKLDGSMPDHFKSFSTLEGRNGYKMPTTQNDIFIWIHSSSESDNFDRALQLTQALQETSKCLVNQTAFIYHDKRDFTGFVDGSANPKEDKRLDAALIPEGKAGAGGSIVFSQKWVHDLKKFAKVPVKEQEGIIGRTKEDSIELEGDAMPHNSHVSRTDLKLNGEALKIWRRSAPFIDGNDHGLFFLAFACHTLRIQLQLESMLGLTPDKVYDRILEFSKAISGSYWFAPSEEELQRLFQ